MGQQVFFAAEKNDCCTRQCCGPLREFEMALTGKRVIVIMNSPLEILSMFYCLF